MFGKLPFKYPINKERLPESVGFNEVKTHFFRFSCAETHFVRFQVAFS